MKLKSNYFSILFFIVLLFILDSPYNFTQMFRLTDIYSEQYSVDRIAQEVYFQDFFSDTIRVVSLKNLSVRKSGRRVLLPFFGNKKHIMLYGNNSSIGDSSKDNIYLYDLDKESYYLITDTIGFPFASNYGFSFSPNDSNFIFIDDHYLSLKDTSFYPVKNNLFFSWSEATTPFQWSSDTSFVFLSGNEDAVLEYFLKSGRLDTLVITDSNSYSLLLGFAYNTKYNILAYSIADPQQIYFHFKDRNIDSLIFLPERDDPDPHCWELGFRGITSLSWSPDNKKLAFLGFQFIDASESGIYIYSLDSNKTYSATECIDYGRKYHMSWINNDTLIYSNTTDIYLYGFDVSSVITSVEQNKDDGVITGFGISNYPNPFNPVTKIEYRISDFGFVSLKVYDILGNEILALVNKERNAGNYEVEFDASKYNLSSGIYICTLRTNEKIISNKMIYLK